MSETDTAADEMLSILGIGSDDAAESEDVAEEFSAETEDLQAANVEAAPVVSLAAPPSFAVLRMVLASMVEQAMLVVPARDTYPPLKNLVLDVTEERLSITGSDSVSTVVSHTTATRTTVPGRVLVPAQKFAAIVRRSAGTEVALRVEGQTLFVESGSASWQLRIASAQDYPALPTLGDLAWHEVDRSEFDRAVSGTRFAAGSDSAKHEYMQLDICDGTVTSSDTVCSAQVSDALPSGLTCAISNSGVDLLTRMLERNSASDFRIANTEYHVVAEIGPVEAPDRIIIAHLMDPFPAAAKAAIRAPLVENRDVLTIDGDVLLEALRRAVPTADEETSAVALKVGVPDPGSVTVATRNRYGDLSSEVITASFVRLGTTNVPAARTVVLSHARLSSAIRAAQTASAVPGDSDVSGLVRLILGSSQSRSRPSFVLVSDGVPEGELGSGAVLSVLSQVRSDWMT